MPKIEIERDASRVRVHIHCAKPGIVIGKGGAEIEKLRQTCEKMLGKPTLINIVEVRNPDVNAQLVAENIAAQLEKRISFRRAMKQCIGRAMRLGAKGIKTQVSGRLGGAKSPVPNSIMKGPSRCRPCAPISTTALPEAHHLWPRWHQGVDLPRRGVGRRCQGPEPVPQGRRPQVMLLPKRVKYRRVHRGRLTGKASRGTQVTYGEFGLVALGKPGSPQSDRSRPCGHDPLHQERRSGLDQDFPRQAHHREGAGNPNGFR